MLGMVKHRLLTLEMRGVRLNVECVIATPVTKTLHLFANFAKLCVFDYIKTNRFSARHRY